MEQHARCKKCGRVLKSPQSIAMGMGWTCAGGQPSSGKTFRVRSKRSTGNAYPSAQVSTKVISVVGDLSSKPITSREIVRRIREERRRLFEERQPFQCGVLSHARTPVIYAPTGDAEWKENCSGKVISHEHLQEYLKKYRFI